jgi:hypothetical protein
MIWRRNVSAGWAKRHMTHQRGVPRLARNFDAKMAVNQSAAKARMWEAARRVKPKT